jgi:peptidoglycan hydrolase CwlO-like protein
MLTNMNIVCYMLRMQGGGIMRKTVALLFLAVLIIGCGPKMANQETLDALAEAQAALDAAQARLADLQAEKDALEAQRAELDMMVKELQDEVDMLQAKIDAECTK